MTNAKGSNNSIAKALKVARRSKGLSQEDFGLVSSRTYISSLERGMKSPTLHKLDSVAGAMGVHPLTLLTMAYLENPAVDSPSELLTKVTAELNSIQRLLPNH
jgi:transcriptional regulator with XRE-family HTH domain